MVAINNLHSSIEVNYHWRLSKHNLLKDGRRATDNDFIEFTERLYELVCSQIDNTEFSMDYKLNINDNHGSAFLHFSRTVQKIDECQMDNVLKKYKTEMKNFLSHMIYATMVLLQKEQNVHYSIQM